MTKEALETRSSRTLSLQEKIAMLDTKIDEFRQSEGQVNNFSRDDYKALYGRLNTALAMKPDALAQFQQIQSLPGRGEAKQAKQRAILFAWLKEPTMGSSFMNTMCLMDRTNTLKRKAEFLTHKQMLDTYGEEELCQMLEDGLVSRVRNPRNPKAFLYQHVVMSMTDSVSKKEQASGSTNCKVNEVQAKALQNSFRSNHLKDTQLDLEMQEWGTEDFDTIQGRKELLQEDDKTHKGALPGFLKRLCMGKDTSNPAEEVEQEDQVEGQHDLEVASERSGKTGFSAQAKAKAKASEVDTMEKALAKCSQMLGHLNKARMSLQEAAHQTKGCKLYSKPMQLQVNGCIANLKASNEVLSNICITKKGSLAKVKAELLKAAGVFKDAQENVALLKALMKNSK